MGGVGPWAQGKGLSTLAGGGEEGGGTFPSKRQKEETADSSWFLGSAAGMRCGMRTRSCSNLIKTKLRACAHG